MDLDSRTDTRNVYHCWTGDEFNARSGEHESFKCIKADIVTVRSGKPLNDRSYVPQVARPK